MRLLLPATLAAAVLVPLVPGESFAHISMLFPESRGGSQKTGPCEGLAEGPVTTRAPGSTLTIRIDETVPHPGHLRVMFDDDVTDGEDFPDPANCDDVRAVDGTTVLGDNLLPAQGFTCPGFHTPSEREPGGIYEIEVTLPDLECDNCALQVIQVMTDEGKANLDGTWNPDAGKGLYFRCADMILSNSAEPTPDPDPGVDPDPDPEPDPDPDPDPDGDPDPMSDGPSSVMGACSAGGSSGGSSLFGLLLVALVWRRRR